MIEWSLQYSCDFEGQQIRYAIRGGGPPLVLVHGTPWSSFNWRHLIPWLSKDYTIYFYDLLGYGQSTKKTGQDVSLGAQSRVLAHLLDHWQLEKPNIIGHDFGGTTVLRANLLENCEFQKIVVVDPVALSPWGSPFFSHVKEHKRAFQGVPGYIHEAIVTAYVKGAMHQAMPEETLRGILAPWLGDVGQSAFYRQIAQADRRFTDEIESKYGSIGCPVLVVWGEEDKWIPVQIGERLHSAIAGSEFKRIAKAGHLVQEDQPKQLYDTVKAFLS
jgi:pimeloyl-ACP methyl ester carboxylesterase